MTQAILAITGLAALWMALGTSPRQRRWAPVVGLVGQPAWLWYAWSAGAWGLFVLSVAYALVYARGVWVQFKPSHFSET